MHPKIPGKSGIVIVMVDVLAVIVAELHAALKVEIVIETQSVAPMMNVVAENTEIVVRAVEVTLQNGIDMAASRPEN